MPGTTNLKLLDKIIYIKNLAKPIFLVFRNYWIYEPIYKCRFLIIKCFLILLHYSRKRFVTIMEKESRLRSVLKAISWRCIATMTTFTLAYVIFSGSGCEGALEKSTLVAGLELVIKLFIYYFHERMWQAIPRGTIRKTFHYRKAK